MNDNKNLKERFFSWIRSTGVMRGDDRWIGGVCSGLAVRLGWSPALTRALLLASTLLFGFGAALYAIAWALLPDARNGRILAEDVIAGQWDWTCVGVIVMFAIALVIPGAGWVAIALAVITLWAICQSSIRQQHGYGFGAHNGRGGPNGGNGRGGGPNGGNGPQGGPQPGTQDPGFPGQNPYVQPQPGVNPNPVNPPLWQGAPNPTAPTGVPVNPDGRPIQPPVQPARPAGAMPASGFPVGSPTPPNTAYPYAPAAPGSPYIAQPTAASAAPSRPQTAAAAKRRPRRQPAGPLVVLMVLGLTLVSAAWLILRVYAGDMHTAGAIETVLAQSTMWISGVCMLMGLVILILGIAGRRSGGMIPLSIIAAGAAVAMVIATIAYGGTVNGVLSDARRSGYTQVQVGGNHGSSNANGMIALQEKYKDTKVNYWVSDASPKTYSQLKNGVWFDGTNYFDATANIDLSRFNRWYHADGDKNRFINWCPAGQINLIVTNANVQVTLPDGCPYSFGRDGMLLDEASAIGGWGTRVRDNNVRFVMPGYSGYEWSYRPDDWFNNGKSDDDVSFQINFLQGNSGKVSVVYASDSGVPSYTDFVKSHVKNDDWASVDATTKHHYDVETGRSGPTADDKEDTNE